MQLSTTFIVLYPDSSDMDALDTQDRRHVDVAILYGLGQKDRAQYVARQLRPESMDEIIDNINSTVPTDEFDMDDIRKHKQPKDSLFMP